MSADIDLGTFLVAAGVTAGGVLAVAYVAKRAVSAGGAAVDPTSRDNVFYSGTNAIGGAIAGDPDFSLGAWLYDITHRDQVIQAAADRGRSGSGP